MVDGSLDLLVAYARLISVPSVIVALPSSWSSSSETSQVPFTKIISGLEECGFYFESDQPDEVHKGRRIWEKWSPDDRNELIDAIGRCWGSILHSSIEKVEYLKQSDLVPGNLSVRTESLSIQQSESQYVTAAGSSEQNFLAEEPRVLWRVSIMATTRESPVRLAAQESISQDWVLVLHKETSVGPDPTNLQGKIAGTQHDEANASYDSAGRQLRRPSIATNTSNSSISSKMTHTSFKSSASGVHQKIEIKSGVPLPIRAASEITQFALPSEGFIANKTVITPSMDRSLGYLGANATVSSGGDLPRSDVTRGAPVFADETSDEPVIWNDTAVAPVNPEDLMKLVINSPVGMLLATPELRIYWVNDRWYDIVKLERGQDLNTWIDGVHPDTLPTLMEVLQGLMQDKAKRTGDIRWKHGSWSTFTAQVLRDADGAVTAITATLDDCTQRKTLELAQLETLKEQEATARRIAEEASARAKELAEWQSQTRILEKRTKEFAQMAEISAIALTCAKPDGELIWANQAFCDLHDLQPHEINQWPSTVLPADLEALNERWQNTLKTKEPLSSRHRLKNGRVLQVQTVPSIAADNKDSLTFVSAIMDVTSEVRHHEAVERLNEERIKEQTRLAGEAEERRKAAVFQKEQQELFIDVTSHELRNSINPILQSALLVKASLLEARMGYSGKDDGRNFVNGMNIQEDLEACDAIIDSANQMERVANDVLGLAQIQANQLAVTPIPFDLTAIMRSIHRMFQADCRAKGVRMMVEMGESFAVLGNKRVLKADPSRLSQTTVNLISNAMKFIVKSQKREVRVCIDISLDKPDASSPIVPPSRPSTTILEENTPIYLYIAVHDTGPGMTNTELGKLFRRFSQANADVHCQMGGSGLGLFIAKQLCELQGGRIEAISSPNEGATFRFFIQAWSVKPIHNIDSPSRTSSLPPKLPSMVNTVSAPLHILVCDDNIINRKTLARQLRQHKHQVVTAEDGQEALDVIFACEKAGTPFDCVVLDVNMHVLDGLAATRRLRVIEKDRGDSRGYWIVGCTGNARTEQMNAALEAGMNAVITKPYNLQELLQVIQPPELTASAGANLESSSVSVPKDDLVKQFRV